MLRHQFGHFLVTFFITFLVIYIQNDNLNIKFLYLFESNNVGYILDWKSASYVNIEHYNILVNDRLQYLTILDHLCACNSLICKEIGHLIMSLLSNIS